MILFSPSCHVLKLLIQVPGSSFVLIRIRIRLRLPNLDASSKFASLSDHHLELSRLHSQPSTFKHKFQSTVHNSPFVATQFQLHVHISKFTFIKLQYMQAATFLQSWNPSMTRRFQLHSLLPNTRTEHR